MLISFQRLCPNDFFSPYSAACIEPFLEKLGVGSYNLACGTVAGAVTVLLNSHDLASVPASRLVDMEKLFDGLVPVLNKGGSSGGGKSKGRWPSLVSLVSTAKRALKNAVVATEGVKLPSMISLLLSSSFSVDSIALAAKTQVLLVHSECDIASLDVEQALAPLALTRLLAKVLQSAS